MWLLRVKTKEFARKFLASERPPAFSLSLDCSPSAETLMAETPQNTDCFLDKSLDWLLGKSSSDFPKSS
jgi:hypothetical protein